MKGSPIFLYRSVYEMLRASNLDPLNIVGSAFVGRGKCHRLLPEHRFHSGGNSNNQHDRNAFSNHRSERRCGLCISKINWKVDGLGKTWEWDGNLPEA